MLSFVLSLSMAAAGVAQETQTQDCSTTNDDWCCERYVSIAKVLENPGVEFCRAYLEDRMDETDGNNVPQFQSVCFGAEGKSLPSADVTEYIKFQDRVAKNAYWNVQGQPHDFNPLTNTSADFSDKRKKTGYYWNGGMCVGLWYPSTSPVKFGSGDTMTSTDVCGSGKEISDRCQGGCDADPSGCLCDNQWMASGDQENGEPNWKRAPWAWRAQYTMACQAAFPLTWTPKAKDRDYQGVAPGCFLDCRNAQMWSNRLDPESELGQRILDYNGANSDDGFKSMYVVPGYCEYWQGKGPEKPEGLITSSNRDDTSDRKSVNDEYYANMHRGTPPPGVPAMGDSGEKGPCMGISAGSAVAPALLASIFALVALALALH